MADDNCFQRIEHNEPLNFLNAELIILAASGKQENALRVQSQLEILEIRKEIDLELDKIALNDGLNDIAERALVHETVENEQLIVLHRLPASHTRQRLENLEVLNHGHASQRIHAEPVDLVLN